MRQAISLIVFVLAALVNLLPQSPEKRPPPPIIDPDTFSFVSLEREKPVIDSFARGLLLEPERKGYIIAYGGRASCKSEAKRILALIKGYLVEEHKIDGGRLVTVDGGYRESNTFEMWRVPPGAAAPTPAPTIYARDVKFLRESHPRCRGLREPPARPRRA
jgi:hypothetical protein